VSDPFADEPPWAEGMSKVKPLHAVKPPAKPDPPEKRKPLDWPLLAGQEPPVRRWAQKGWFGFGHTTLLVGAGGIGKTLLSQQLGSCLALGRVFVDETPGPLKVLMWACEDDHDELWRRQIAIAKWQDCGLEAFAENLVIVPRHGLENALVGMDFGKVTFSPLLEELKEQAADLGADVVILDNVAQLYGANENDRHSVTVFLNALAGALPGRAILLLAHPARSAGSEFSGSSAWENTARTRLYLGAKLPGEKQDGDEATSDDVRYLARRKSNYSNRDWRKFNYRDGVLVPEAAEITGGIVGHLKTQAAERLVLKAIERLAEMGVTATDGTTSPRFLPRAMKDYNLSGDFSRRELADAMRKLMLAGKVVRTKVGERDNRNPVYGLKVVETSIP
jgi:hypothetical protein